MIIRNVNSVMIHLARIEQMTINLICANDRGPAVRIKTACGIVWTDLAHLDQFTRQEKLDSGVLSLTTPKSGDPNFAEKFRLMVLNGEGDLLMHQDRTAGMSYQHQKRRQMTRINRAKTLLRNYPELDESLLRVAQKSNINRKIILPGDSRYDFAELRHLRESGLMPKEAVAELVWLVTAMTDDLVDLRNHYKEAALRTK